MPCKSKSSSSASDASTPHQDSTSISRSELDKSHKHLYLLSRDLLKELKRQRRGRLWRGILFLIILGVVLFSLIGNQMTQGTRPHIAQVQISGIIADGLPASADFVIDSLKDAYKADSVEAIVLNINSPGGSAVDSDRVFNFIMRQKTAYPEIEVIAVCSDICASGGYYMAAAADEIYANGASLVGSIGVIYSGFGLDGLIDNLDIERRLQTAGENKAMLDAFSPQDPKDTEMLQTILDSTHQMFIEAVKEGRGDRLGDSDSLFSGRIWSGFEAKESGLVDQIGSIEMVQQSLGDLPIFDYTREQTWFEQLMATSVQTVKGELSSDGAGIVQGAAALYPLP